MEFEELPTKKKRYAPPPPSQLTFRALAIAHFFFAAILLSAAFFTGAVEGSDIDQDLANSLANVDSPQAQALRKNLQRTGQITEGLKKYVAGRSPSTAWVPSLDRTVDVILAMVVCAGGMCLLQKQPLGRPLSIGFAAACLAQKALMTVYIVLVEMPLAKKYCEPLFRMYPHESDLINGVLSPIVNGPIYQLAWAMYPVIVLIVMIPAKMPPVQLKRSDAPPPPDLGTGRRLAPPAVAISVSPVEPDPVDPLEAMLQKKTF